MTLREMSLKEFGDLTASNATTPGGGSVSALCGSLAAALSAMVGRLTINRQGYESVQTPMKEAIVELEGIRQNLLIAIDEDAESFNAYMSALKMPKNTDEEKVLRQSAMEQALKEASLVPLHVAQETAKIFQWARLMLESGNPHAATDAMVSVLAARTATLGALLNVRINLQSIKDRDFVQTTLAEVLRLETIANEEENQLMALGYRLLNRN